MSVNPLVPLAGAISGRPIAGDLTSGRVVAVAGGGTANDLEYKGAILKLPVFWPRLLTRYLPAAASTN